MLNGYVLEVRIPDSYPRSTTLILVESDAARNAAQAVAGVLLGFEWPLVSTPVTWLHDSIGRFANPLACRCGTV